MAHCIRYCHQSHATSVPHRNHVRCCHVSCMLPCVVYVATYPPLPQVPCDVGVVPYPCQFGAGPCPLLAWFPRDVGATPHPLLPWVVYVVGSATRVVSGTSSPMAHRMGVGWCPSSMLRGVDPRCFHCLHGKKMVIGRRKGGCCHGIGLIF